MAINLFKFYVTVLFTMDANTLLILNDDCLDYIFQYFKLEELLLLLGNVHSRFDAAIERQLHRFPNFEFCMRFPPPYTNEQLQTLGRHLQSLNINVGYSANSNLFLRILQQLLIGAAENGRLRRLKIKHTYIYTEIVKILEMAAPSLIELDVSNCEIKDRNSFKLLLRESWQLKELYVFNIDVEYILEQIVLSRLKILKINWLIGTDLFDVNQLSQQYPSLSIYVYQSDRCDVYGPVK